MIKGIYNENEFYTNFYWDNKFLDDLRAKQPQDTGTTNAITTLKSLDTLYWPLKESSSSSRKDNLVQFYEGFFRALGYTITPQDRQTKDGKSFSVFGEVRRDSQSDLLILLTEQVELGAFETVPLFQGDTSNPDTNSFDETLSDLIQSEFQESQNPPRWILVGAPNAAFLLERGKWSFGRFIKIDLQETFLQRDQKPYEAAYGILGKTVLCPDSGSSIHDEIDDNSHRHAFEVTTELRESVRESIEILINEMIFAKKEAHEKYLRKDASPDQYAKELTHDALFYVYRLIFLLFLEAQGDDSELLPLKSEIYRAGYSLEKLLELDFVNITPGTTDYEGTFLQESLDQIFALIYNGFGSNKSPDLLASTYSETGFLVKGVKSDLFNPDVTKHLKGVNLRNGELQKVLIKLSLTRTQGKGKVQRARVSYSNLGINQLGAVYEGLLSYTGFFAQEDLHALKPLSVKQSDIDNGKKLEQIYLTPKSLAEKYRSTRDRKYKLTDDNLALDEYGNAKIYKKGSFVYRLAGRDRQKLASYYTPESLTQCTVKYALKVLFETKRTLKDLWSLTILEPAMGSGAFLSEAVSQVANRILELEIDENIGTLKTPKEKQQRIYEIRYQLISNNVYGVDLNPTAIELARFSMWLNCIESGMEPPRFDGKLKIGNSLIGARFKKGSDGIYPWLLLDSGMLAYGKRLKDYDAKQYEEINEFRKALIASQLEVSNPKIKKLQLKAEATFHSLITNEDGATKNSALTRLKRCCDLWCSLFFLGAGDLRHIPPSHEALCDVFDNILDGGQIQDSLSAIIDEKYTVERFFHWEIEFPQIIASGGFDLVLGNPPWVAVEWKESVYAADLNPLPALLELDAKATNDFLLASDEPTKAFLINGFISVAGYSSLLESDFYKHLKGLSKNTYKAFNILAFSLLRSDGVIGLIQQDGVLEDVAASQLRKSLYTHYVYHFQFINQKRLFSEVGNTRLFSVNIFRNKGAQEIAFDHIGNLFSPRTIDESYAKDNIGHPPVPGLKDQAGNWELTGHPLRIVKIDEAALKLFKKIDASDAIETPRFLNIHSSPLMSFVSKLCECTWTFSTFTLNGSNEIFANQMWDEVSAQQKAFIIKRNSVTSCSVTVLSGPNIGPFNPYYQQTKDPYANHRSYEAIELTSLTKQYQPRTIYQAVDEQSIFDTVPKFKNKSFAKHFRLANRGMIDKNSERCTFGTILAPNMFHTDGITSLAIEQLSLLPIYSGILGSLVIDGLIRLQNKSNFNPYDFRSIPIGAHSEFLNSIGRRSVALNGLTIAYDELWRGTGIFRDNNDALVSGHPLNGFGEAFSSDKPLKLDALRKQCVVEIDSLVALLFGLDAEALCSVYKILFPVLVEYDKSDNFDREQLMRTAYAFFQKRGW